MNFWRNSGPKTIDLIKKYIAEHPSKKEDFFKKRPKIINFKKTLFLRFFVRSPVQIRWVLKKTSL